MGNRLTRVLGGEGQQAQAFTLDPGLLQYVQSVLVEIDNSGGPDIQPTLTVATTEGVPIADKQQGRSIPAGDTGRATWALRLDDESAGGGGGFTPLTEYFRKAAFTWDTVPLGGSASLSWENPAGDTLLDLTNPKNPLVLASGVYAISTGVVIDPSTAGLVNGRTILGILYSIDSNFFLPLGVNNSVTWSTTGPAAPAIGLAMTRPIEAGGSLVYSVTNDEPVAIGCQLGAMVVKLS